jgi:hypothetical protein
MMERVRSMAMSYSPSKRGRTKTTRNHISSGLTLDYTKTRQLMPRLSL